MTVGLDELDFDDDTAPRRGAEPSPMGRLVETIAKLRRDVEALQRGSQLRNASISGGEGLRILDEDGTLQAQIAPDRTVTIFDQAAQPVVRMGAMQQTGPQAYGIEVRIGSSWIQLGSQNVSWDNVGAKPATFPPTLPIPGSGVSGNVAGANDAVHAGLADGSQYGFSNTVGGDTFYALWVGNDGGFHFGRNTSSKKYKFNIRKHTANKGVLAIELADFDRKDQLRGPAEGIGPEQLVQGSRNEFGAIAEQVAEVFPEAVQYFEGEIDGIRYEMIGLGLVPVVREHDEKLDKIATRMAEVVKEQAKQAERLDIIEKTLGIVPAPAAPTTPGTTKGKNQ